MRIKWTYLWYAIALFNRPTSSWKQVAGFHKDMISWEGMKTGMGCFFVEMLCNKYSRVRSFLLLLLAICFLSLFKDLLYLLTVYLNNYHMLYLDPVKGIKLAETDWVSWEDIDYVRLKNDAYLLQNSSQKVGHLILFIPKITENTACTPQTNVSSLLYHSGASAGGLYIDEKDLVDGNLNQIIDLITSYHLLPWERFIPPTYHHIAKMEGLQVVVEAKKKSVFFKILRQILLLQIIKYVLIQIYKQIRTGWKITGTQFKRFKSRMKRYNWSEIDKTTAWFHLKIYLHSLFKRLISR